MILSFRHKALRQFYDTGSAKGLDARRVARIRLILTRLDASSAPEDMNLPGLRLHPLKGRLDRFWAVSVSGNWRIIFRFEDGNAMDVDLVDYH